MYRLCLYAIPEFSYLLKEMIQKLLTKHSASNDLSKQKEES